MQIYLFYFDCSYNIDYISVDPDFQILAGNCSVLLPVTRYICCLVYIYFNNIFPCGPFSVTFTTIILSCNVLCNYTEL